jgi:tetratricopeptide (TPR) repeat protein/DNA-binding CsgD family transcriptional regulator
MWRSKNAYLFLLINLLQAYQFTVAQSTSFPVDKWAEKLSVQNDVGDNDFAGIAAELSQYDSTATYKVFGELDKKASPGNHYFNARIFLLKAYEQKRINFPKNLSLVKQLFEQALLESYATGNTKLISFISWQYGEYMYAYQQIELAATYCLTAVELNKDILEASLLGEILFHAGDYTGSIYYTKQAIDRYKDSVQSPYAIMQWYNTLGQGYRKTGQLDSALLCYEKSFSLSLKNKDSAWKAINSAYMGEIFFLQQNYENAKPLLEDAYRINKINYADLAGFALQWLARIDLAENKKDSALFRVKEALILAQKPEAFAILNRSILENVYNATADIYRSLNKTDSFYRYFQLYSNLHDSLQRTLIIKASEIAKMRLDNEKDFQAIQTLQHEKVMAEQQRNFIVLAILMLSLSGLLILNRQRQKSKFKQQLALQEKAAAKAEVAAAREQLQMFTQNIIEKSDLIEKLQYQVKTNESNVEQQQLIEELTHQAILTEEDWMKFKILFEKIHPRFFIRLKEKVADITVAEQRMAAFTRLHLSTRETAGLLGISPKSVNKTKQRLRHRFNLSLEANIEEFISKL